MKESEARKILGLKPKENPHGRIHEFEDNLRRKLGFVDNSPSQETKARYQADLNDYQKAFEFITDTYPSKAGRNQSVLIICLILIAVGSAAGMWKYEQGERRAKEEARVQREKQNLLQITQFQESGRMAAAKRKWTEAQQAYESILAIDPESTIAQAGFDTIREGKLEERNQKIFYTLGNSQAALEAGRWAEATKLAQSVLDENPKHPQALAKLKSISAKHHAQEVAIKVQLVTKALEVENLSAAQKALDSLIKSAPYHARVQELSIRLHTAMAALQARQKQALELLKQARTLDNGQFSGRAIELLDEAKLLDPANPEVVALYEKMSLYTRTLHVPADFPTISEALSASRPRDRIMIAAGTYNESLTIEKNVRLEGSADGKTIIELPADSSPLITVTATAESTHLSSLTLNHTGFDHDEDRASALIIQGGAATVSACHISNAAGHGIAVIDGAKVSITGCQISDSGWDGISVYGVGSRADVRDTISQNNIQQGIGFWKGGSGHVFNSRVLANGLCGVLAMSPGTKVSIQTTLCARNRGAGILISDQVAAEITANRCDKNLLSGIVARGLGTRVSISNSITTANEEAGILIHRGVKRESFSNNKATGNKKRQIWIDAVIKGIPKK